MKIYDRSAAAAYAERWALSRNPAYYNFDNYALGGDCTNFVSQCIHAGGADMNYARYGWYYVNLNSRAPAWTGVEPLFTFLTTTKSMGVYAEITNLEEVEVGDVIQFSFDGKVFSHSVIVTDMRSETRNPWQVLVSTHSSDHFNRPLATYPHELIRYLHINIKN